MINFGIEGRDLFGCQITRDYPMPNYQYDCTDPRVPPCDANKNMNLFNLVCGAEKTEKVGNLTYKSFEDILKTHNLTRKHITLKIDIEGGEYPTLRYFPLEYLDYIDQIVSEWHHRFYPNKYWGNLDIYKSIA